MYSSQTYLVGVDLGGSNVRALLADGAGAPVAELAEETVDRDACAVVRQLAALCRRLAAEAGVAWSSVGGVAVGVPGVVAGGGVEMAPNLPPFDEVDLATALGDALDVPIAVDNDVNVATEAEHRRGHGVGVDDFVFVAVGTGIGMGIVAGGRLQRGATGAAGEIGSLLVAGGTLEGIAGGVGVAARFAVRRGIAAATAQDVFGAAAAGDVDAELALYEQADALAAGVAAVQSVLDPALVVFGGGIGSRADVVARVESRLRELTVRPPEVRTSALGERAGVIGAVEVARERHTLVEQVDV